MSRAVLLGALLALAACGADGPPERPSGPNPAVDAVVAEVM